MVVYQDTVPLERAWSQPRFPVTAVMLALWLISCIAAFLGALSENSSLLAVLGSGVFLVALWFSLQADIVRHLVPDMPRDTWIMQSVSGLILGVGVGVVVGYAGAFASITSAYGEMELALIACAVLGSALGFATLGWLQTRVLRPCVHDAWLWTGVMTLAWIPVLVTFTSYDAILQLLPVNIYPGAHVIAKIAASEVALLCPALAAFALIARRSVSPSGDVAQVLRRKMPTSLLVGLAVSPLAVIVAFVGLLAAQALRVEQTWVAVGTLDYLSFDANGQVLTAPPVNESWNQGHNLVDRSKDGATVAQVSENRVLTYNAVGGGGNPARTFEVFPPGPPADYHFPDVINIVRLSPDNSLLAVGTGQARPSESAIGTSQDHAVHIWAVTDGRPLHTFTEPVRSVRALAWSPDGKYLAAGGGLDSDGYQDFDPDYVLRVWRIDRAPGGNNGNAERPLVLKGHRARIEAVAWSPDGSRLASRDMSGMVVVWRMK